MLSSFGLFRFSLTYDSRPTNCRGWTHCFNIFKCRGLIFFLNLTLTVPPYLDDQSRKLTRVGFCPDISSSGGLFSCGLLSCRLSSGNPHHRLHADCIYEKKKKSPLALSLIRDTTDFLSVVWLISESPVQHSYRRLLLQRCFKARVRLHRHGYSMRYSVLQKLCVCARLARNGKRNFVRFWLCLCMLCISLPFSLHQIWHQFFRNYRWTSVWGKKN